MAFVLGAGLPAAAKPTPAQKCTGAKMKAAAKKVASELGCYAKAASKNVQVDSVCLGNAGTAFMTAFSKAELKGGCLPIGDAGTVEATIDAFVQSEATALPPGETGGKCASSKRKAAGSKAKAQLLCNAKAATKSIAVDLACLSKAGANLTKAFTKAEKKGGCVTTGDARTVEQAVDALVAQVVAQLTGGAGTTTTTTTTAATTTTGSGSSTTTSPTTTTSPSSTTSTTMGPTTHTVIVGPASSMFIFDPATLTIHVGDTVQWMWATGGHSVVSGTFSGTPPMEMPDGKFCSPNDTNCDTFQASNPPATYQHTFTTAGSFPYYCAFHANIGMLGTIEVTP
jgi:plastocyanin